MIVEVQEKLGSANSLLVTGFDSEKRARVSEGMSIEVQAVIVAHLQDLAQTRHTTADRLGGTPTGFIGQLAENFDQASTVSVDDDGVSLSMESPIIARAFRPIDIYPKGHPFLPIPLNGAAYGHSPREFDHCILVKQAAGGGETKERKPEPPGVPVFLLVREVHQQQDPTLFPTQEEILTAAARGAGREIRAILTED